MEDSLTDVLYNQGYADGYSGYQGIALDEENERLAIYTMGYRDGEGDRASHFWENLLRT